MTKLVIPVILSITILVAGIFAFIPVEQASTVHDQIIPAVEESIPEIVPPLFTPLFDAFADLDADHDEIIELIASFT